MDIKKLNEELIDLCEVKQSPSNIDNGVNLNITSKLITGDILGKPVSDDGGRPMFFPEHQPDFSKWEAGFRLGTINKSLNVNVEGSIKVEKDVLYYIPAKPYTYTCLVYSPVDECWFNHGKWTCNAYSSETNGQYQELLRCSKPISVKEASQIINGDATLNLVKDFEKVFKSVGEADKEKLALQVFKIIKQYL